jgi:hypothetical protein
MAASSLASPIGCAVGAGAPGFLGGPPWCLAVHVLRMYVVAWGARFECGFISCDKLFVIFVDTFYLVFFSGSGFYHNGMFALLLGVLRYEFR